MISAALVLVSMAAGACGVVGGSDPTPTPTPETYTLTGHMLLDDRDQSFEVGVPCSGTYWTAEWRSGRRVDVKEDLGLGERGMPLVGKILATSSWEQGVGAPHPTKDSLSVCLFKFQATGIPRRESYLIDAGARLDDRYSFADMQANNWTLEWELSQKGGETVFD